MVYKKHPLRPSPEPHSHRLIQRFPNAIIEPIRNRRFIDNIQITVSGYIGVEGRGGYYDQSASLCEIILNDQLADALGTPIFIKKDTS